MRSHAADGNARTISCLQNVKMNEFGNMARI